MLNRIFNLIRSKLIDISLIVKQLIGINFTAVRLDSGEILKIRNIDIVGLAILKGERFESITRRAIMSRVCEGMIVLDIGANIGYYTVQMARKVGNKGKVIAFEPNPVVTEQLLHNLSINKLTNTVFIEQLALSDCNGDVTFCSPEPGKESHGSLKQNITFETKQQFTVKTEKLDDVLKRLGISKVDFIKIDVEGAEMLIFKGASELLSSQHKPPIVFESAETLCQPFGHRVFDVLIYLNSFGYNIEQFAYGMWIATPRREN